MNDTILITGGTGYVGSWITKMLLEKGYTVRLTLRDKSKAYKYKHLEEISENSKGKLELWEADLLKAGSYDAAANGAHAIIHVASPFTLKFKDAQKELIDPAVKGTRNVLMAANLSKSVKKVVLTSSVAAVHGDNIDMYNKGIEAFTENDFNDTSSVKHQPYSYSKVLAEKEAWNISRQQSNWQMVVINPSFVMGPSLTPNTSSESIAFMKDLLKGKYYLGIPDLQFGFVDVRDVAKAHILALENEKAQGRHILAERTAGISDIADIVKKHFGRKYKLPLMKSPKCMLYFVGWMFGITSRFIKRNVGHPLKLNTDKSKKQLGLDYRPLDETIKDMVLQMEETRSEK